MKTENELSGIVVDCAFKVHKALGPGLLESAYEACMVYELKKSGLRVRRQHPLPLIYDDVDMEVGYRLDILVENKLIVELKAVEGFHPLHMAQLITYLRLSEIKLGLLINFNVELIKNGIRRCVNKL